MQDHRISSSITQLHTSMKIHLKKQKKLYVCVKIVMNNEMIKNRTEHNQPQIERTKNTKKQHLNRI